MKENVTIEAGQHNVVALVAGQGRLELGIRGAVTAEFPGAVHLGSGEKRKR
ncbi:MAG: hypothetical protein IPO60_12225 [Flavobacteriales bacterium]|nr:hypothetical protein [Flavobacteriales bacterium]